MYQPDVPVTRNDRGSQNCLRICIAVGMSLLMVSSLMTAIDTTLTADRFSGTGLPDRVTTHALITAAKYLLLLYCVFGLYAVICDSETRMHQLYYLTILVLVVVVILAIYAMIPCGFSPSKCDLRPHFEKLSRGKPRDPKRLIEKWVKVNHNFRCCGLDGPVNGQKKTSLCWNAGKEWHLNALIGPTEGCVAKANCRDKLSRYYVLVDLVGLIIMVALQGAYYCSSAVYGPPSCYIFDCWKPEIPQQQQQHQQQLLAQSQAGESPPVAAEQAGLEDETANKSSHIRKMTEVDGKQ